MNTDQETSYCIVDICGTLYDEDTTLGLIRHHLIRQNYSVKSALYWAITNKRLPFFWCFVIAERLSSRHLLKHLILMFLNKETTEAVEQSAKSYLDYLNAHKKNMAVWSIIEKERNIFLASASTEPFVQALADSIGSKYVASKLEIKSGRYTGKILEDATGRKQKLMELDFDYVFHSTKITVISDNLTDLALMASATHPIVVINREKDRARWGTFHATYLTVH